ncbi:hypothetical protein [Pseudonocardia ammonioxydans]|nr:hypothetical protein [Pseudonocardia ammonioxydans]
MDKLRDVFNRPSRAPETSGPRVVDAPDASSAPPHDDRDGNRRTATTDERTSGTDARAQRDESR